jgi:hypothetical protein
MNTKLSTEILYDVVVIGGGPAGMMAAVSAAQSGRRVLLLEKNRILGKKLLITGGGRCNVTNNKPLVRNMLSQYKGDGKFLFSAFMQHGVKESVDWFESRSVPLKEENEGRLFPQSNTAQTVRDTLATALAVASVTVRSNFAVKSLTKEQGVFIITNTNNDVVHATHCIIATGGTSRPETGSTGEGYEWLRKFGHTIVPNNFALVPLTVKESFVSRLSGLTLNPVGITVYSEDKKYVAVRGKLLFTHVGVTGPSILNLSQQVGDLLSYSQVTLSLNLLPDIDAGVCKTVLQNLLTTESNKKIKNVLAGLLPAALCSVLLSTLSIPDDTPCHSVKSEDRKRLRLLLQAFPLTVKGLQGADKAVISAGGVALEEINFKTMESQKVPGLFIIGDLLNIDRPSGGYSLQLCWTTGFVAGSHA